MPYSRPHGLKPLGACLALLLLMTLNGCKTLPPPLKPIEPPSVRCEERAPAEPTPEVNAASQDWRYWYEKWLEAIGQKSLEVQKRATTANCLDDLRKSGVIR